MENPTLLSHWPLFESSLNIVTFRTARGVICTPPSVLSQSRLVKMNEFPQSTLKFLEGLEN